MSDYYNYNLQYPELYKVLDPEIDRAMERHLRDRPDNYMPDQQEINEMVEEIYKEMIKKYPEINQDPYNKYNYNSVQNRRRRKYYGRKRILDDFIWFIIIERLLRRRRRPYRPYRPYQPYPTPYRSPYNRYDY